MLNKKSISSAFTILALLFLFESCKKSEQTYVPKLIIKIKVDSTLGRLGNNGQPVGMPTGHSGQHPLFNKISGHYLELTTSGTTPLGEGAVLYHAPETTLGGATAIDFDQSKLVTPGEVFLELPLSRLNPGTYQWARLSLSYQNYDVKFYYNGQAYTGTLASFVGYNTYLRQYKIKNEMVTVNANKLQGYWGFETINGVNVGQAPAGATTVPNPLFNSSPIPAGSCLVTGGFSTPLVITGNETSDVVIDMNLSVNNSFEWIDANGNGRWDVDGGNEQVVDMGLRGLFPTHNR
ncbi:MAG: hypothetical protein RIR96_1536 [Bacteroidota bacterium]